MTTPDAILAAAISERSSTHLRIYADWLEERGEPLARGWRMLAESGKWPLMGYIWARASYWAKGLSETPNDLPDDVFDAIKGRGAPSEGGDYTVKSCVDTSGNNHCAFALTTAARAFEQIARQHATE